MSDETVKEVVMLAVTLLVGGLLVLTLFLFRRKLRQIREKL